MGFEVPDGAANRAMRDVELSSRFREAEVTRYGVEGRESIQRRKLSRHLLTCENCSHIVHKYSLVDQRAIRKMSSSNAKHCRWRRQICVARA
ncbi:MAG: hypothetical protein ABI895_17985 [Deltaproteobacteria bacterium]